MLLDLVRLALVNLDAPLRRILVACTREGAGASAGRSQRDGRQARVKARTPFGTDHAVLSVAATHPRGNEVLGEPIRARAVNVAQSQPHCFVKDGMRMLPHRLHRTLLWKVAGMTEIDVPGPSQRRHAKAQSWRAIQT